MRRRQKKSLSFNTEFIEVESSIKRGIILIIIFVVAVAMILSIFDVAGGLGRWMYKALKLVFGGGFWIFPFVLLLAFYLNLNNTRYSFRTKNWIGVFLMVLGYSGFFHLIQNPEMYKQALQNGIGGGYLGFAISYPLFTAVDKWLAMVFMLAFFVIGFILMFNTPLEVILSKLSLKEFRERRIEKRNKQSEEDEEEELLKEYDGAEVGFEKREVEETESEMENEKEFEDDESEDKDIVKTRKRYPKIDIPIDLLNNQMDEPTARDVEVCKEKIKKTLNNFGIEIEMGEYSIGPTVTQYTFRPAEGVKLSRIVGLGNDLALALAAHPIRIEAPIPGKSLVGIEVPNKKIAIVPLRHALDSKEFKTRTSNLTIALGQDVAGKAWMSDLSKLPHLLVAGATNSGKTVCLNSIIISLLYQNQPDELKFILVDPKRVELIGYNGIPHLLTPVVVDIKKTINALKWTTKEMERRFHVLSEAGKRNIQSYNITHPRNKLPYLVFIIDELADLMSLASAEVEAAIIRLAQMSRAVGIHLVLATQRPSVDIITGLIKANIPGRIAFAVASLMDSRTILDMSGAEKLLGRGDMLYSSAELSKPKRLQGAFCSDADIENVVEYLREKGGEPEYEEDVVEKPGRVEGPNGLITGGLEDGDADEYLDEARELIVKANKASASYLQRRLRIGYARAARILDLLEEEGTIGPGDGSKPREIFIKKSNEDFGIDEEPDYRSEDEDNALEEDGDIGNGDYKEEKEIHVENDEESREE